MGPHAAGNVEISWNLLNNNGVRVPPGAYQIDVVASNSNGTPIPYQTRVRGYVDGISYESGTPQLIIGATRASVSNIIGVYPGNISN
jgi:flagellar hook assembly protein FlgD